MGALAFFVFAVMLFLLIKSIKEDVGSKNVVPAIIGIVIIILAVLLLYNFIKQISKGKLEWYWWVELVIISSSVVCIIFYIYKIKLDFADNIAGLFVVFFILDFILILGLIATILGMVDNIFENSKNVTAGFIYSLSFIIHATLMTKLSYSFLKENVSSSKLFIFLAIVYRVVLSGAILTFGILFQTHVLHNYCQFLCTIFLISGVISSMVTIFMIVLIIISYKNKKVQNEC